MGLPLDLLAHAHFYFACGGSPNVACSVLKVMLNVYRNFFRPFCVPTLRDPCARSCKRALKRRLIAQQHTQPQPHHLQYQDLAGLPGGGQFGSAASGSMQQHLYAGSDGACDNDVYPGDGAYEGYGGADDADDDGAYDDDGADRSGATVRRLSERSGLGLSWDAAWLHGCTATPAFSRAAPRGEVRYALPSACTKQGWLPQ